MTSLILRSRALLPCALLALTVACSQQSPDAAADESAAAKSACATGSPLPITGLCSDGNASLFLAIDPKAETFGPRCVWRTEEVETYPNEALVFRAQDCSGEGWDKTTYTYQASYVHEPSYLKTHLASMPAEDFGFALEVVPLLIGETAEQAAMHTLSKADPAQRPRCEIQPLTRYTVAGRAFELGPNAELRAELDALYPDEPWDACGPNGVSLDAIGFWEGRDHHALFHMLGQDTPIWDPASFTFYRKGADGVWTKVN